MVQSGIHTVRVLDRRLPSDELQPFNPILNSFYLRYLHQADVPGSLRVGAAAGLDVPVSDIDYPYRSCGDYTTLVDPKAVLLLRLLPGHEGSVHG